VSGAEVDLRLMHQGRGSPCDSFIYPGEVNRVSTDGTGSYSVALQSIQLATQCVEVQVTPPAGSGLLPSIDTLRSPMVGLDSATTPVSRFDIVLVGP